VRDGIALAKRDLPAIILVPRGLVAVLERSLYGRTREEIAADALALGPAIRRALSAEEATS
jgi:hypothetical protein